MIGTVPSTDRVTAPWVLPSRWLDWLHQAATAVLHVALRLSGFEKGPPELRMSREWLEEYERRCRKHPDGV
jgi:hypothetical protein